MEMKEVINREGREAKNLLVYQFCADTPEDGTTQDKVSPTPVFRKPPVAPPKSPNSLGTPSTPKKSHSPLRHAAIPNSGPRVRSASTGRDKKSELQARYWALLFGNLQRAVNEIYQTVECYENISSCQEAILVLDNYVRDFKALSEWFKVSWDYESRPLQQRPHSLAWEVRKSNPGPRVRAKSLSSPTMSGKSSPCAACPCNSGKSSPCCGCGMDVLSPRKGFRAYDQVPKGAMRVNVRELFASSKRQQNESTVVEGELDQKKQDEQKSIDTVVVEDELIDKRHQYAQTDLEDDHLTLADIREKVRREEEDRQAAAEEQQRQEELEQQSFPALKAVQPQESVINGDSDFNETTTPTNNGADENPTIAIVIREPTALEMTVDKLNSMENEILAKDASKAPTPQTAAVKKVEPIVSVPKVSIAANSNTDNTKKTVTAAPQAATGVAVAAAAGAGATTLNGPLKYSSVLNRPAVSARTLTKPTTLRPTITPTTTSVKPATLPKATCYTSLRRTVSGNTAAFAKPTTRTGPGGGRNPNTPHAAPPPRPSSKTESYGPPTHVASRLSARSRTMIEMNATDSVKAAMPPPPSSLNRNAHHPPRTLPPTSLSRKSSREDIGSSSSTLKASNERISSSRSSLTHAQPHGTHVDERHSEPKQLPSDANDGWLMVKNRRRSSMHWANRFNQPTGYASLPTLSLLNEKRSEEEQQHKSATTAAVAQKQAKVQKLSKGGAAATERPTKVALRPEIRNAKAKVNSLPVQRKSATAIVSVAVPQRQQQVSSAPTSTRNPTLPSRQTIIKRQKSDLTGLKMTSLHKEFMRSEKYAQRKQSNQSASATDVTEVGAADYDVVNGNSSSTETATEGNTLTANSNSLDSSDLLHLSESGEQNKIDIKIQTNRDFSKTIGDLYESISLTAKAAAMFTNGIDDAASGKLSSCDENEEALAVEMDCDEDQRMLVEEQEALERQIRELESTEIDVDTETDETDCEVVAETETDGDDAAVDHALDDASSIVFVTLNEDGESDENLSLELRYQALLSEMSWGEREEALATLQAYVSRHPGRAQELHQKLSSPSRRRSLQETLKKYQAKQARAQQKRELLKKEKAIKIQQLLARVEDVKAAKRQLIEDKRLRMEDKMQRAAENREQYLRQIIEKAHDEEKKLKEINFIKNIEAQNKRLDLIESSKETEGRLQDLEQERQKRLEEKAAKEAAVERRRQELEKERQRKLEKMNETRLEKEQRIGKMQEQKERQRQALAREKARDREERLLALQVQQQQTTEELQRKILQKQKESARRHEENIEHIRQRALELTIPLRNADENGIQQRGENGEELGMAGEDGDMSSTVSDVGSREHTRGFKKKMKKLKQRMTQSAEEYMKELQPVPLHMKRESQVPKYLNLVTKGGGAQGLERPLGQLLRLMGKAQVFDFQCFLLMDGLATITQCVISKGMQEDSEVSKRAVVLAVQLYRNACTLCPQISRHALLGNTVAALFDALFQSLQLPEEKSPQHPVELSTELMLACTVALSPPYSKKHTHPKVLERLPDLISYAVITGLIEILSRRCMKIRESIENHQCVVLSLLATLGFLTRFVDDCPPGPTDVTRLLSAARSTELFGSISMLYASVVPIGECIPPRTVSLAAAIFNLLVSTAVLDLATFQDVMSSETLSLKFLDVVTILLNYCGGKCTAAKNSETYAVIIDLIATIGFFCANNKKNQDLLTSEQCSIIIKSLTKLPEHLNIVVYPCLVAITFQNQQARNVISRDFSLDFLDEYSKSDKAKKNHLVALLKEKN